LKSTSFLYDFDGWKLRVETILNHIASFPHSKSKCQNFKIWESEKHEVIRRIYYDTILTKQLYNLHEKIVSY
jgi:hypothetical protein